MYGCCRNANIVGRDAGNHECRNTEDLACKVAEMYGFSALEIQSFTKNHTFRRDAEKYGFRLYDCRDTGAT